MEKDLAKEKILTAKSAPEDTEVKVSLSSFHSAFLSKSQGNYRILFFVQLFFLSSMQGSEPLYRRRKCRLCCCVGVGLVVLVGVVLLILVFAVFKAKDPEVTVNGVRLADLNITTSGALVPRIRLELALNITVHNPNRAAFKYTNGSSVLYYQAIQVGQADIPAGRLGAGHTITEVVTLDVQAEKFLMGSNFTKDFTAGNQTSLCSISFLLIPLMHLMCTKLAATILVKCTQKLHSEREM